MPTFRRNPGQGPHILKIGGSKVTVRSGETVTCDPVVLGNWIDQYIQLDGPAVRTRTVKRPVIQRRGNSSYYDVVNPDVPEKPLNEKALRLAQAEDLLTQMGGGVNAPDSP